MSDDMITGKFTTSVPPYAPGEVASFSREKAKQLIASGAWVPLGVDAPNRGPGRPDPSGVAKAMRALADQPPPRRSVGGAQAGVDLFTTPPPPPAPSAAATAAAAGTIGTADLTPQKAPGKTATSGPPANLPPESAPPGHPLHAVEGIGPGTYGTLEKVAIRTVADLRAAEEAAITALGITGRPAAVIEELRAKPKA
jgi:predicted flap endonuclease-1-like 5' DNA nuclease